MRILILIFLIPTVSCKKKSVPKRLVKVEKVNYSKDKMSLLESKIFHSNFSTPKELLTTLVSSVEKKETTMKEIKSLDQYFYLHCVNNECEIEKKEPLK